MFADNVLKISCPRQDVAGALTPTTISKPHFWQNWEILWKKSCTTLDGWKCFSPLQKTGQNREKPPIMKSPSSHIPPPRWRSRPERACWRGPRCDTAPAQTAGGSDGWPAERPPPSFEASSKPRADAKMYQEWQENMSDFQSPGEFMIILYHF